MCNESKISVDIPAPVPNYAQTAISDESKSADYDLRLVVDVVVPWRQGKVFVHEFPAPR